MTEKLYPFVFKDTGIEVFIRKVSTMLVVELQKAFPPPTPPKQVVNIGGEMIEETNPAHPDHIAALGVYNSEFEQRVRKLLVSRGVIIPEANKTWEKEAAELKKFWLETYEKELPGDDKIIFISYLAVGTDADLNDLLTAIMQRSQPTEGEVAAAKQSFQG